MYRRNVRAHARSMSASCDKSMCVSELQRSSESLGKCASMTVQNGGSMWLRSHMDAESCLCTAMQLYQEAGVEAEGFTGVPVFQVRCCAVRLSAHADMFTPCIHSQPPSSAEQRRLAVNTQRSPKSMLRSTHLSTDTCTAPSNSRLAKPERAPGGGADGEDGQGAIHAAVPQQGRPGHCARQRRRPAVRVLIMSWALSAAFQCSRRCFFARGTSTLRSPMLTASGAHVDEGCISA